MSPTPIGIIQLARAGGEPWEEFEQTCLVIAKQLLVHVHSVSEPVLLPTKGQRVRTVIATLSHPDGREAKIRFNIGVRGDEIFTGYSEPPFWDYYEVRLADGQIAAGELWWVNPPEEGDEPDDAKAAAAEAWRAVSPLKMVLWEAIYARQFDEQPLVDDHHTSLCHARSDQPR